MLDVSAFPFQPRRLWHLICVGASINDFGNVIAEFLADIAQSFSAAAIFHCVMKQRANCFNFIRAILERDGSYTENMRNERNSGFLARLITMRASRINQRLFKFFRQLHAIELYLKPVYGKPRHCSSGL